MNKLNKFRPLCYTFFYYSSRYYCQKYYLKELDPEKHSKFVASNYLDKEDYYETLEEATMVTKYYMEHGPSFGVFLKADGTQPVAWLLSNLDRAGFMGTTLPEHQGLNIASWPMKEIVNLRIDNDEPFASYIAKNNTSSLRALSKVKEFREALYLDQEFVHCTLRPNLGNL